MTPTTLKSTASQKRRQPRNQVSASPTSVSSDVKALHELEHRLALSLASVQAENAVKAERHRRWEEKQKRWEARQKASVVAATKKRVLPTRGSTMQEQSQPRIPIHPSLVGCTPLAGDFVLHADGDGCLRVAGGLHNGVEALDPAGIIPCVKRFHLYGVQMGLQGGSNQPERMVIMRRVVT